jgi:hypothetical protein
MITEFFQRREKNTVRNQIFVLRHRKIPAPVFHLSCPTNYPVSEEKFYSLGKR